MKKIEKIEIAGATKLTAMDMNKIHFETGKHSDAAPAKKSVILA